MAVSSWRISRQCDRAKAFIEWLDHVIFLSRPSSLSVRLSSPEALQSSRKIRFFLPLHSLGMLAQGYK